MNVLEIKLGNFLQNTQTRDRLWLSGAVKLILEQNKLLLEGVLSMQELITTSNQVN